MCKKLTGKDKENLRKKCITAMANILSTLYPDEESRLEQCKELVPDDYDDCVKGLDY